MWADSPMEAYQLRPTLIKRICYIALGLSTFILILAFSTPSNYQQASVMYFALSLILSVLVKYEKFSLAADFFIIGFNIILILAAYLQKSAYVFSGTIVLIIIAAFLKSAKYITTLFLAVLGVVFFFLALDIFTLQQILAPDINIGLVNNAVVMLVMLTLSYPEALFIQKVLISKLKSNKDILEETEERFRSLFEESPIATELWNANGKLVEVNQACLDLFGIIEPNELQKLNLFADRNLSLEMKENLQRGYSVRYEAPYNFDIVKSTKWFQTKRSGTIHIEVEITPLKKKKPLNARQYLVYVQDITDHKQAMQILQESRTSIQRAYEDALQVSEMKTNLLSFASHELKTPLVPIMGWVGVLKSLLEKGKKIDEFFGMEEVMSILHACERIDRSISKFLDLGRLESKKLELQKQDHSLGMLFANSVECITPLAQSREVILHSDVPNIHLQVDGFRIEEVFINILSNAIKYSPPNSQVWVTAGVKEGRFTIVFRDEGAGFTEEQLKHVWRPFSVNNSQEKSNRMGSTGIGLFLSKGIVEQHGGAIEITSPGPGKGSTVTISLPPEILINK